MMKRFLLGCVALLLLVPLYYVAQSRLQERNFQLTLNRYSHLLKPGTSRKHVEEILRSRGVVFERCCIDAASAYTDLVTLGWEDTPWYCDRHLVYVAIEFAATEGPHPIDTVLDSDALKTIKLTRREAGCL